jgi:hypothetical protein
MSRIDDAWRRIAETGRGVRPEQAAASVLDRYPEESKNGNGLRPGREAGLGR